MMNQLPYEIGDLVYAAENIPEDITKNILEGIAPSRRATGSAEATKASRASRRSKRWFPCEKAGCRVWRL